MKICDNNNNSHSIIVNCPADSSELSGSKELGWATCEPVLYATRSTKHSSLLEYNLNFILLHFIVALRRAISAVLIFGTTYSSPRAMRPNNEGWPNIFLFPSFLLCLFFTFFFSFFIFIIIYSLFVSPKIVEETAFVLVLLTPHKSSEIPAKIFKIQPLPLRCRFVSLVCSIWTMRRPQKLLLLELEIFCRF